MHWLLGGVMSSDKFSGKQSGGKNADSGIYDEFDCPVCNANNPYSEGFKAGAEIRCFYCGTEFRTSERSEGKLKLREL